MLIINKSQKQVEYYKSGAMTYLGDYTFQKEIHLK